MALTSKKVAKLLTAGEPGRHFDAHGLYLVIGPGKASAHWERRYRLHDREHFMGLGSATVFGLAKARERNRKVSELLADKIDPLAQRRAERAKLAAEAARSVTFGQCAEEFFKTNATTWKHRAHVNQWSATVLGRTLRGKAAREDYCGALRRLPVQGIDTPIIMQVLRPIWHEHPETGSRVRARIENVLDYAKAAGYRSGDNPADWDIIGKLLPARSKVKKVKHFAALPYRELPAFMGELRQRQGSAARALEFAILAGGRTDEVLKAPWREFDLDEKVWTIPAERMKGKREHLVPLSPRALALLRALPREAPFVFIGGRQGKGLSDNAMRDVMKRMGRSETVHGFRSSFSDWAHEQTAYDNHSIEISLAHAVGAKTEQAYRRGNMFEKRRKLMEAWSNYCMSPPAAERGVAERENVEGIRGRSRQLAEA